MVKEWGFVCYNVDPLEIYIYSAPQIPHEALLWNEYWSLTMTKALLR